MDGEDLSLDIYLTKELDTVQHNELVKNLGMYNVYQVETKGGCLDIALGPSLKKSKDEGSFLPLLESKSIQVIPNDDERVDPKLKSDNKSQSDSSSSFESGRNSFTTDLSVNSEKNADSSDNIFATQDEWIDRFKARLVDQGFSQKEGIDYEETFSPVVKMALRQWNAKLTSTLIENGFIQSKYDYSLYTKSDKGVFLALLVCVDDIIITGNNVEIEKFKVIDTDNGICLNQRKYVLGLLSEYGMLACKPVNTPLISKLVISDEATKKDHVLDNITDYQKLMGKLIYLTNTRHDISYVVHCLSQFMHSPLTYHLKTDFKIMRYLKGCPGLGIHFIKNSGISLSAFSDHDWAKCVVTRKSITGYCVFLNNSLISWKSKKQTTLFKYYTEAEYRALASVTSEVIWILRIRKDLKIKNLLPVCLHCDSNSAIKIAANPIFHERAKHLEINLHFVREFFLKGVIKTVKVNSANQITDILTKGLDTVQHNELVKNLGMLMFTRLRLRGNVEIYSLLWYTFITGAYFVILYFLFLGLEIALGPSLKKSKDEGPFLPLLESKSSQAAIKGFLTRHYR
ncbi:ribonuclease H-like domain-containing protein [Tanacetum coccineum]